MSSNLDSVKSNSTDIAGGALALAKAAILSAFTTALRESIFSLQLSTSQVNVNPAEETTSAPLISLFASQLENVKFRRHNNSPI